MMRCADFGCADVRISNVHMMDVGCADDERYKRYPGIN
jgi:hypothetical protein